MTSANYAKYNIPSTWTYITYSGGYYYYRVGSISADGSVSRTISYTAATAKTKLSNPANVTATYTMPNTYTVSFRNNNSTSVTALIE